MKNSTKILVLFFFLWTGLFALMASEKRPSFPGDYREVVKAKDIQVSIQKEGRLIPILPAKLTFDQESGPITDPGIVTCDAYGRQHPMNGGVRDAQGVQDVVTETVLRCGPAGPKQRVLIVTGVEFGH